MLLGISIKSVLNILLMSTLRLSVFFIKKIQNHFWINVNNESVLSSGEKV